jgi:hypothetical protein
MEKPPGFPELQDYMLLPVAVRAYAVPQTDEVEEEAAPPNRLRRVKANPARNVLIIDVETRTDYTQRLTFGSYRYFRDGSCLEEGLFYADDLPEPEVRVLLEYARRRPADTDTGVPIALRVYPFTQFVHTVFYRAAYKARCLVVGYNLPFDLSRLAWAVGTAKTVPFTGGFSFIVWTYTKDGQSHENSFRPRIVIKSIDSKRALKGFAPPLRVDAPDRKLEEAPLMKTGIRNSPVFRGNFLDLHTLVFGLTDKNLSLKFACEEFESEFRKGRVSVHGTVNAETIDYNRQDVRATGSLLFKVMKEYSRHPINVPVTQIFSPASIGKGYLAAMGILPILGRQPDFPPQILGYGMAAYYGGWAETRIRRVLLPVVYLDFLSMYPTVNTLMGTWRLIISKRIETADVTEEIGKLLYGLDWRDLFDKEMWKRFLVLVQIRPEGHLLPARAPYDAATAGWQVGVNPLWLHPFDPVEGLWYSLPDVLLTTILTGHSPHVVRAIRLVPSGIQPGLRPISLRGEILVDPMQEDFFKRVIEERKRLKWREDLTATERGRLDLFLKVLANSTSYGIMAEMNRRETSAGDKASMKVWGVDGPFDAQVNAPEVPGRYFFAPLAAVITGAARLMLALAQRSVAEHGGVHVMCDTDSLATVSTGQGGLIHCPGGPERFPDGREAVRALSWANVEAIREMFTALNPYEQAIVPGSILELERENFDEATGQRRQLYCFAISAKRYALLNIDEDGAPALRKWSEHGLGHLLDPTDPKREGRDWIRTLWEGIVTEALGQAYQWPNWLDKPAIGRVTISTPHLLVPFASLNRGKPYAEQITPFTFLLSAHVAPFGHPEGIDPKRFHLFAPYTSDSSQWLKLMWTDVHSTKSYRASTTALTGSEFTARIKTIGEVVNRYRLHPETKSLGPEGKPCGPKTVGVLGRRPVVVLYLAQVGKESNRLEDVEAGVVHDLDDVSTEYRDRRRDPFWTLVIPVLRRMPRTKLLKETELSKNAIKEILSGRARPRSATRVVLIRRAAEFSRAQLRAMGRSLPRDNFGACFSSLVFMTTDTKS